MSSIIFKCYSKYLNNKPIKLTKEINFIKNMQLPKLKDFPIEVRNVRWYASGIIGDFQYDKKVIFFHLFNNKDQTIDWLHNKKYGWKRISKIEIEEITSINKYRKGVRWLKKFYNY
jgi:hypothetical protein